MYIAKVYCDRKLEGVAHFNHFENAVAAIAAKRICNEDLSDKAFDRFVKCELKRVVCASESNGISDDFEFQFTDGICVYVGRVYSNDNA